MTGLFFFIFFLACGLIIADCLFSKENFVIKAWAGLLFGFLGLMWNVVPFAFIFGFTVLSHAYALVLMGVTTMLAVHFFPSGKGQQTSADFPWPLSLTVAGISLVIMGLMFCHTLLPKAGGFYAGPSVYGDLPFHLGIITNLVEQKTFPPEDSIFPGIRLAYPFLIDSLSAMLTSLGMSLRWALLLPGLALVMLVVVGFVIFAREVLGRVTPVILAAVLFFFNGGLGFLYFTDGLKQHPENFFRLFTGFYHTPTTLGEQNIVMWNVICHVLLPQRTTLVGWAFLFFILWLLYCGITKQRPQNFLLAGILGGLLPMVHTASFLILTVIALTWLIVYFFSASNKVGYIKQGLSFFVPLIVLALPQLCFWAAGPLTGGKFSHFQFNAINEKDFWLIFWIKNVGVVFVLAIPAVWAAGREPLRFYSPAIVLFILGESILFGPWRPDNNKVFYIWLIFTVILVAEYVLRIFDRLAGEKGRGFLLGLFIFLATFSGGLSVAHDFITLRQLVSPQDIVVADFVKKNTFPDAVFLCAPVHNNPVSMLAGRKIVVGHPGILFSHGLDYGPRVQDIEAMYTRPEKFQALQKKYQVDYVYWGDAEKDRYKTKPDYFDEIYPKVFAQGDVIIYAVSRRAQELKNQ